MNEVQLPWLPVALLWLLAVLGTGWGLHLLGLVPAAVPLGATLALLALGGVLLVLVALFAGYYAGSPVF